MAKRFRARSHTSVGQQLAWWLVSFVFHAILLAALSYVEFATIPAKKKKIQVKTEFVEAVERLRPLKKRDVFNKATQAQRAAAMATLQAQSTLLSKSVPVMTVGAGNIGAGISSLFQTGGAGAFDFGGRKGSEVAAQVKKTAPQTYEDVLDDFAADAIELVRKRKRLLVVLLVDESASIFDDRKAISQKIDSILGTLKKQIDEKERHRLKWAMVSFGATPKTVMRPTENLAAIKNRIMQIKFDESGVENTVKAINYTLKTFVGKQWRLFIAAVTDESGSDTGRKAGDAGTKGLDQVMLQLKGAKTQFYVFGREACFSYHQKWTPIYDLDGRVVDYNWADAGTETPEPELLPFRWRFNDALHTVDSGFGMYTLTYLTTHSGGNYFIMSDAPSRYDEDKLEKNYSPEIIPRSAYVQLRKKSKIRAVMHFLQTKWPSYMSLTIWFSRLDKLNEDAVANIKKARVAYDWIKRARRELEKTHSRDKTRPYRWKANRELTIAQLAKHQFLLRQYWITLENMLRKGWPFPKKGVRYTHFSVNPAKFTEKPPGGRIARKELREAQKLLRQVAEDYKELPWGTLAERDLQRLRPFYVTYGYYEHHERRKQ